MKNIITKKIVATATVLTMSTIIASPVFAYSKEETVYSKINNSGESYKTIVSEHLKNTEKDKTLKDISELLGITNVNGEETFKQEGNELEWQAEGKDIYYQGNIEKEMPLECTIKYELDEKEIEPKELIGKSGKVKIKIEYKNKEKHVVNINGSETTMYTPFVVFTGTILDNEKAKDITITNGKTVDNGKKTMVIGITTPGLQESLGLNNKNLDIEMPENIEIEFNATEFEMENIISYATPKILEDSDLEKLDQLDDLYKAVDTLSDSSKQLVEGANKIKDGTAEVTNGTQALNSGITTAYNGSALIQSEVQTAIKGLKSDKAEALDSNTINQIGEQAAKQAQLSEKQQSEIGEQAANQANATIQKQLEKIGAQAETTAKQTVKNQEKSIKELAANKAQLTENQKIQLEGVMKSYLAQNPVYKNLSEAEQTALLQTILPTMDTLIQNSVNTAAQEVAYSASETTAQTSAKTAAQTTAQAIAGEIANETAKTVATQTASTAAQQTAKNTASQVANKVKNTAQENVISQMNKLNSGLTELTSGLSEIKNGADALVTGTETLSDSMVTLSEGLTTFNNNGIQKIADLVNGDVKDIEARVEKLKELANEYETFAGKDENVESNVKFIWIIDSIKKNSEDENSKATLNNFSENYNEEKKDTTSN